MTKIKITPDTIESLLTTTKKERIVMKSTTEWTNKKEDGTIDQSSHPIRSLEIPWMTTAEFGKGITYKPHDEKLNERCLKSLEEGFIRFDHHDLIESDLGQHGDYLRIDEVVPYLISTKSFGIGHHVIFEIIIGETYRLTTTLFQVDHGNGGCRVLPAHPVHVPPRQPLYINVTFQYKTHNAVLKQLTEMSGEDRFVLGIKLIGVRKSETKVKW